MPRTNRNKFKKQARQDKRNPKEDRAVVHKKILALNSSVVTTSRFRARIAAVSLSMWGDTPWSPRQPCGENQNEKGQWKYRHIQAIRRFHSSDLQHTRPTRRSQGSTECRPTRRRQSWRLLPGGTGQDRHVLIRMRSAQSVLAPRTTSQHRFAMDSKSKRQPDRAERIYRQLAGARGLDDAELWQHALLFAMSPQERCHFSLKTARLAVSLRRSAKKT